MSKNTRPLILETRSSSNRISQTPLRPDGKIQRRQNESVKGPVTVTIGDVKTNWASMTMDITFKPEE